jgi:hypothetical protein
MKAYVHEKENSDLSRWGDLTESIRGRVPGACVTLRNEFGRGLELILRRQVPQTELSQVVDEILANVMLSIECEGLSSPDLLPALVRRTARVFIPTTTPWTEMAVNVPPSAVLECILQQLPDNQREALAMVYVDGTDDQTTCARTGLTINELIAVKDSVRERFRITAIGRQSRAMSQ